jgi:hypothetical protein
MHTYPHTNVEKKYRQHIKKVFKLHEKGGRIVCVCVKFFRRTYKFITSLRLCLLLMNFIIMLKLVRSKSSSANSFSDWRRVKKFRLWFNRPPYKPINFASRCTSNTSPPPPLALGEEGAGVALFVAVMVVSSPNSLE